MKKALILFAHGARDPQWAGSLQRVQSKIRQKQPTSLVELAFLEFMTPNLSDCVDALAEKDVSSITIVPMFIAQNGHVKRDIPAQIDELRRRYPHLKLHLAQTIGETDSVIEAMADYAASLIE